MGFESIGMGAGIAFATHDGFPDLTDDDRLAVTALAKHDIEVDACLWNDPKVDWSSYSAVVIRSCWDYHLKPEEFRAWLDRLESQRVMLWNPYKVIRWNMDKTYLQVLQEKRIPVLSSVWLPRSQRVDLGALMRSQGWNQAVVKPMISAAANNTEVISLDGISEHQKEFDSLLETGGLIVQEFAEEVQTHGEWSLIFFNKEYSHAVIKRPRPGDFRVQRDFGGTTHSTDAPHHLIDQAWAILDMVEDNLLYARVDGIERDSQLVLMELELIEPHLFFEMHSQAADGFADAFTEILSAKE
jgi:hypothetical protein